MFSIHMSYLFIIKICLINKVNTICGGGQLLVSGSQGPISRVPCPRVASPKPQGPGSQVSGLGSQSLGTQVQVPDFRS